jgi:hypothetical protein
MTILNNHTSSQVEELCNDHKHAVEILEKESNHKESLLVTMNDLEKVLKEKDDNIEAKLESLAFIETEPGRISRQTEAIDKAITSMELELSTLLHKIKVIDTDIEKQAKKKIDSEAMMKKVL